MNSETCGLVCLSPVLYIKENELCGSCQVIRLALGTVVFNFRSKRLAGLAVLGCAACMIEDSQREAQHKAYRRVGEPQKVTTFTQII